MSLARRDTYNQLLRITKTLDANLTELCQAVIPILPEVAEPQRQQIAQALSLFAQKLATQVEASGDLSKLADGLEHQANEAASVIERLKLVRGDLQKAYRAASEVSPLRTQLVKLDEHLAAIEKQLVAFVPRRLNAAE